MKKEFKQVTKDEFIEFVNPHRHDITIKDQYDTNPPLICYVLNKSQSRIRCAYIVNNDAIYNNKPNTYFVSTRKL